VKGEEARVTRQASEEEEKPQDRDHENSKQRLYGQRARGGKK